MQAVIEMAAARALRGVKLRTIRDPAKLDPVDVLELKKHVLHLEHGPGPMSVRLNMEAMIAMWKTEGRWVLVVAPWRVNLHLHLGR